MYLVVEIQTTGDQTANIVTTHQTREEAESKFYLILSAAAMSQVPKHAASLLDDNGRCLRSEVYTHEVKNEDNEAEID